LLIFASIDLSSNALAALVRIIAKRVAIGGFAPLLIFWVHRVSLLVKVKALCIGVQIVSTKELLLYYAVSYVLIFTAAYFVANA
jgi:hypothetical protein